jgi:hypothetical protein
MSTLASTAKLLAAGVLTGLTCAALTAGVAAQQKASPPDFSSGNAGWLTFNVDFSIVPGGSSPIRNDAAHPRVSNQEAARTGKQPNYFIADLSNNTILKPWVLERMKKDNAEVLAERLPSRRTRAVRTPVFQGFIFMVSSRSTLSRRPRRS